MSKETLDELRQADRRTILKYLGTSGVVTAGAGAGLLAFTGSGAAASVDVTASNPGAVTSDDGELDHVFVEPSLTVAWDGTDDVVGKVRVLVEAATGAVDLDPPAVRSLEYTPVFRATGYANGTSNDSEDETGPGTNGEFQITWFEGDEQITLYDTRGVPDYENATYTCGATTESYLDGTNLGDPIDGARNGFYGAAGTTDEFGEDTDRGSNTTAVYLRYTVSLHAPDASFVSEDGYDVPPEDLRPYSPVVMPAGDEGQYPDLTDEEYAATVTADVAADYEDLAAGDDVHATAVPYSVMRENTDHPAIVVDHAHFDVTVDNQAADAGVSGDSDAGASADEEVDTLTDEEAAENDDGTEPADDETNATDDETNATDDDETNTTVNDETNSTVGNDANATVSDETNATVDDSANTTVSDETNATGDGGTNGTADNASNAGE